MPGFARVAGEFAGQVTFLAVDIGPFVGLGSHEDGIKLLRSTGTGYPAGFAVDQSALREYGVAGTPTSIYFDRHGRIVKKLASAIGESQLRGLAGQLVAIG